MCWCIWDQKVNFSLETEMFFWDQNMNFLGDRIWCFWVRERPFWIGIRECQFWWSGEAKCLAGVLSEREGLRIKNSVGIVRALAWRNIYIREMVNFKVACISCMARLGEGQGRLCCESCYCRPQSQLAGNVIERTRGGESGQRGE